MYNLRIFCILISSLLVISACKKPEKPTPELPDTNHPKLLICNEGNYGGGNATLSVLDLETDEIFNKVYQQANNGEELGDVLMHAHAFNNNIFLVINNSNQIIIIDKDNYKKKGTIPLRQPRYIFPIPNSTKAYVTSMYHHMLYVIDLQAETLIDSVRFPYPNVEHITFWEDQLIVSQWDTNCSNIYILNQQLMITDSIRLPNRAPMKSVIDKHGKLWILSGNMDKGVQPYLSKINLNTKTVEQQLSFAINSNNDILKLNINSTKDSLYFLGINYNFQQTQNGLFKMSVDATALPPSPFIAAGAYQYFWDYWIDETNEKIYLTDPRGFVQRGDIIVYNKNGQQQKKFETHIGPGYILPIL